VVKFAGLLLLTATLCVAAPVMGATLYISNTKSESASIIDTDTLEVVGTIQLGQGKPSSPWSRPVGTPSSPTATPIWSA
jgi:YVTN family beta-propeller protein